MRRKRCRIELSELESSGPTGVTTVEVALTKVLRGSTEQEANAAQAAVIAEVCKNRRRLKIFEALTVLIPRL